VSPQRRRSPARTERSGDRARRIDAAADAQRIIGHGRSKEAAGAGYRRGSVAALLLAAALAALPARGALFDDDEARKRIDALRGRVDQLEARINALESTVKSQGLVDLLRDIEQIKADVANLRGQQEVITYELEQAQKRQRDLYLDLDGRLRKLEGATGAGGPAAPAAGAAPVGAEAAPPPAAPGNAGSPGTPAAPGAGARVPGATDLTGEQRAYDTAFDQFKSANYPAAIASFQTFVRTYPRSALAPSAMYWQGNAQFAQRDYRGAMVTQRQLLSAYPDSQKVPDALLNIASCQVELGDNAGSRRTLQDIVARFPTSEAAGKARQRLGR
jgi:tol-pal system protein YbgF